MLIYDGKYINIVYKYISFHLLILTCGEIMNMTKLCFISNLLTLCSSNRYFTKRTKKRLSVHLFMHLFFYPYISCILYFICASSFHLFLHQITFIFPFILVFFILFFFLLYRYYQSSKLYSVVIRRCHQLCL